MFVDIISALTALIFSGCYLSSANSASLGGLSCAFAFSFARLVLKWPVCIVNFFLARTEPTRVRQKVFLVLKKSMLLFLGTINLFLSFPGL